MAASTDSRGNEPLKSSVGSSWAYTEAYRDDVLFLKDDPFFQTYTTPHSEVLARQLRSSWPSHRPGDAVAQFLNWEMAAAGMAEASADVAVVTDINIAIIGAEGAGKSTLIQRALGLRHPPLSVASTFKMNIDNTTYSVSLIELDLEAFDFTNERRILWPKQVDGIIVPRLDGALILYDVMNIESISHLPQTMNAMVRSSIPTIVVATKCENPPNTRQIDVEKMEATCTTCLESRQTSTNKPESARNALSAMLRAVLTLRTTAELHGPRRRAASSANLRPPSSRSERPSSQSSKHGRASSDLSVLKSFPAPPTQSRPPPPGSITKDSFLDNEESDAEAPNRDPEPPPTAPESKDVQEISNRIHAKQFEKIVGLTFDELVDRLVSQNMSRQDTNFQEIFLCLYRKFAAPGELFAAIVQRFEKAGNDPDVHYLIRTTTQMRILNVLIKWIDNYPGDFASPRTSYRLDALVSQLSTNIALATVAQELCFQLDNRVVVNDDTGWARSDADISHFDESLGAPLQRAHYNDPVEFSSRTDSLTIASDDGLDLPSRRPSAVPSTSSQATQSQEDIVRHPSYHTVEDYESEARTMTPRQTLPLTKIRYHIFMDTPDDDFAEEMTRIDWVMFSSIRIRDLVRHVSLSLEEKEKCRSLTNVNRAISHFNHIARWVSNMVLMRDKAKHRAQMLEKFMRIASKLRIMNNYNGLGAVIAGINGSAIHRLTQTRALISPDIAKRFMRLELLMGYQKSHFAYRLAWENSPMPRIPFIPLHRRDLVSAEEGSRTFVGKEGEEVRINWRKFEVLGEVILPIMRSRVTGYEELRRREQARELVLDCRMPSDEEEIYQRSLALESSNNSAMSEFGKKKFPWFQK